MNASHIQHLLTVLIASGMLAAGVSIISSLRMSTLDIETAVEDARQAEILNESGPVLD